MVIIHIFFLISFLSPNSSLTSNNAAQEGHQIVSGYAQSINETLINQQIAFMIGYKKKTSDSFIVLQHNCAGQDYVQAKTLKSHIKDFFLFDESVNIQLKNSNFTACEDNENIKFIKNTRVISPLQYSIIFQSETFKHDYQLTLEMQPCLIRAKKIKGAVAPFDVEEAYEDEKRSMSFNSTSTIHFDRFTNIKNLPADIDLSVRNKTKDLNISSSWTDTKALYDAIKNTLNLDPSVPMEIVYNKNGLTNYYRGGKLNNIDLEKKDFDESFRLRDIRFPDINEKTTDNFIENLVTYDKEKKITREELREIYYQMGDKKIEWIKKRLYSSYYNLTVSVQFVNNQTTIGDIENAVRKSLKLTDDVSIRLIYAGLVQEKIKKVENNDKDNVFNRCNILLGNVLLTNELRGHISSYIKDYPNAQITTQFIKNHSSPQSFTPTAPKQDISKEIESILNAYKEHFVEGETSGYANNFKEIISNNPFILQIVINNFTDKNDFIAWFKENCSDSLPLLIYWYPDELSGLYKKDIFLPEIEEFLQKITLQFPAYLSQKNAIAEILNNYEYWQTTLTTNYPELNKYLENNFGDYINYRYYQLITKQNEFIENFNETYQYRNMLAKLYLLPTPTAPPLENNVLTNNSENKNIESNTTRNLIKYVSYTSLTLLIFAGIYKFGPAWFKYTMKSPVAR